VPIDRKLTWLQTWLEAFEERSRFPIYVIRISQRIISASEDLLIVTLPLL
jgi:hypothetical protein